MQSRPAIYFVVLKGSWDKYGVRVGVVGKVDKTEVSG
jgi:hypothetical protein